MQVSVIGAGLAGCEATWQLARRSSSLSSPTAFSSWSERREFEQHSSAKSLLWCAGVLFAGFIS